MKEVMEENFGGEYASTNGSVGVRNPYTRTLSNKRSMSAYMLVYIRKSRLDDVLPDVAQDDTPPHLQTKLEAERELRRKQRQAREEEHLYLSVGVITDDVFRHYEGLDLACWDADPTLDPAAPKQYRVLRASTVQQLIETVAMDMGANPAHVRLWVMVNRQNKTVRPDQPLTELEMTVDEAYTKKGTKAASFRLWAEKAKVLEAGKPVWPIMQQAPNNNTPILLFVKYFDVEAQTLKGVGHVYIRKNSKVMEVAPSILEIMGWQAGVDIKLYEEIKPSMIEPMKPKQTLHQAEIQDGDVICFQKVYNERE